jgi:tetratricopeptide (TPR) repeat protein
MRGSDACFILSTTFQKSGKLPDKPEMTPYRAPLHRRLGNQVLSLLLVTALGVTPTLALGAPGKAELEATTRSGWDHFYSSEYDEALSDFEKVWEARPDDANALNHVLDALIYRELYRYNALDTRLYSKQGFINSKQVPIDSSTKQRIKELTDQSLSLSDKRLRTDPRDVQALYSRGVTEGLRSSYQVIVEHAWFSALRSALAARHDHEEVLKLHPDWADAKTIVGAHNFVVGSLSAPMKAMAGIAGIRGDKVKGLEMLAEAGKAGGETSADARIALALFLRREERFMDAVEVVRTLTRDHPRSFLFALEEANLLNAAGKTPDAAVVLTRILSDCQEGKYPNPHLELAYYAMGESQRGQGKLPEALQYFLKAAAATSSNTLDYRQRAMLAAGQISDLLLKREDAVIHYRETIALGGATEEAASARKYLARPYRAQ